MPTPSALPPAVAVLFISKVVNHDPGIAGKLYLVQKLKETKRRLMEAERAAAPVPGAGRPRYYTNIIKL